MEGKSFKDSVDIKIEKIYQKGRLESIVVELDELFQPKLSFLVDLNLYINKLFDKAINLVLKRSNDDVGLISFYINSCESYIYISLIGIKKKFQHCGFGKILLNEVIKIAENEQVSIVELEVEKDNDGAIYFYEKNKFVRVREKTETTIIMMRNI